MTHESGATAVLGPPASTVRRRAGQLRRATVRATLAPSVRNSQPWRFVLGSDDVSLYVDPTRRVPVFDPTGRQMLISCGCALFHLRAAMAAGGNRCRVRRFPDPGEHELLASVAVEPGAPETEVGALDAAIEDRRTCTGPFTGAAVRAEDLRRLGAAAAAEDGTLGRVTATDAARATRLAMRVLDGDPAYLGEAHAYGGRSAGDLRGLRGLSGAQLPEDADWERAECLVLSAPSDDPAGWLRAGEALDRLLLEATRCGLAVQTMSVPIEVPAARALLGSVAETGGCPQVVLRVGRGPVGPASRRRRLNDVIVATP